MELQSRLFASIIVAVIAIVGLIFLQPTVEDRILPDPERAWVGIEVDRSGQAVVGPVELESGSQFRVHAVLEARRVSGDSVFYTEAAEVVIDGQPIPPEQLRRWDRRQPPRIRWFTVEGRRPYLDLAAESSETISSQLEMVELLRSNWSMSWVVPGELESANDDHLERYQVLQERRYGTQRYQVQFEFYADEKELLPEETIRSWGKDQLPRESERFPTVTVGFSKATQSVSRVFGLTQLDLPDDLGDSDRELVDDLLTRRLAFTRVSVIGDHLAEAGTRFSDLQWQSIDLRGELSWGEEAAAGDLLRVGNRIVVLFRDTGTEGVLDYQDLCFDFVRGAAVRVLADVFAGEGEAVQFARPGRPQ